MVNFLALHPMESISLNLFFLLEHLVMLLTSVRGSLMRVTKWPKLVWPRKYAHSSFNSLVHSLLPNDTLLRTYLTSLQLVTGTVRRR